VLIDGWDREREQMTEEFRRRLDEKENENCALIAEQELYKTRVLKGAVRTSFARKFKFSLLIEVISRSGNNCDAGVSN
jgi:hypothetical protein